jgi:hypothetical protein
VRVSVVDDLVLHTRIGAEHDDARKETCVVGWLSVPTPL